MGSDEHFTLAWHLRRAMPATSIEGIYQIRSPGHDQRADDLLVHALDETAASPGKRLFFFGYFPENNNDMRDTLASFIAKRGNQATLVRLFRKEIIAVVWGIQPRARVTLPPAEKPSR